MRSNMRNLRLFVDRRLLAGLSVVLILCTTLTMGPLTSRSATAATNGTINFQARLMTGTGAIAADGDYNVEFKFYDTASTGGTAQGACTGNCKWMETRTGANKVHVANGYLTVNLGSVTSFGS